MTGNSAGYLNPTELRNEIRKYKNAIAAAPNGKPPQMQDELGVMLLKLANRFASRSCFVLYSYREDFVMVAIEKMIKAVEKIDPDDPRSPFSYLTQTCYRAFIQHIKKEKLTEKRKQELADDIHAIFTRNNKLPERHNPNLNSEAIDIDDNFQ